VDVLISASSLAGLRESGEVCSKHRVARLMRENNFRALHGYRTRRVSVSKPAALIPNVLKRQFTVTRPNSAYRHKYMSREVTGMQENTLAVRRSVRCS
jgi:transposase InsO family protein